MDYLYKYYIYNGKILIDLGINWIIYFFKIFLLVFINDFYYI